MSNNRQEGEDEEPRAIKTAKQLQDQPANSNSKQDKKNKKTVLKELEEEGQIKGEEESQRGGEQYEDEEPRQGS
jgi:hypothetical protein